MQKAAEEIERLARAILDIAGAGRRSAAEQLTREKAEFMASLVSASVRFDSQSPFAMLRLVFRRAKEIDPSFVPPELPPDPPRVPETPIPPQPPASTAPPERQAGWPPVPFRTPLYAFVDKNEPVDGKDEGEHTIVLDATTQSALDALSGGPEACRKAAEALPAWLLVFRGKTRPQNSPWLMENGWFSVTLLERGEGLPVQVHRALDDPEGIPAVATAAPLSKSKMKVLRRTISLVGIPRYSPSQLRQHFRGRHASTVGVYDVGQGNCNALCDPSGVPVIYYDLGGGCLWNSFTYRTRRRLCFTQQPIIILSHWDFDHWFSATREPQAMQVPWLAPEQPIGPMTWKFAARLEANRVLRLWPNALKRLRAPSFALVKCIGTSKNDSGLAAFVRVRHDGNFARALLPGDAAFPHIPVPVGTGALAALVATHHGSARDLVGIPRPTANAVLAYSFGANNTYRHPTRARLIYQAEGWQRALETPQGSIALGGPPPPTPCLGRVCDLTTVQA